MADIDRPTEMLELVVEVLVILVVCGASSHRFIYLCFCAVLITECRLGQDRTQVKLPSSLCTREEVEEGSCQQSE